MAGKGTQAHDNYTQNTDPEFVDLLHELCEATRCHNNTPELSKPRRYLTWLKVSSCFERNHCIFRRRQYFPRAYNASELGPCSSRRTPASILLLTGLCETSLFRRERMSPRFSCLLPLSLGSWKSCIQHSSPLTKRRRNPLHSASERHKIV